MKRACLIVCVFVSMVGTAFAQNTGVSGDFVLQAMAHTPDWPHNKAVNPWDGRSDGEFRYTAIPCKGNAPLNNISSNLPTYGTRIPGSRSPASTRAHPIEFSVSGDQIRGKIDFTVCKLAPGPVTDEQADAERDKIIVTFQALHSRQTSEESDWKGTFEIVGGTGRYANLTGQGSIQGYFFCYDPKGCSANDARLRDLQFTLNGAYVDPKGLPGH